MTDIAADAPAEPDGAPRIAALDVLRGIAILGILFMNIDAMGAALLAHAVPKALGWTPLDRWAWCLRELLAEGTARAMLEMLFGAGLVILTERAADGAGRRWRVLAGYGRRNLVLFGLGLVHVFVLGWFGDILHTYGIAAMIAFPFRRWRPGWLLLPGLSFAALIALAGGASLYADARQGALTAQAQASLAGGRALSADQRGALRDRRAEEARQARLTAAVERAEAGRRGSRVEWFRAQTGFYRVLLDQMMPQFAIWEAAATMLIGVALFRWGVLQGSRSPAFYLRLAGGGYLLGLTLRAMDVGQALAAGGGAFAQLGLEEVARLATTLGHVGTVHLLLSTARGRRLLLPFAAAGRTALSLYICQTLVVMWLIFSPFGLGLYGRMSWAPLMATALLVDAGLLLLATVWLRYFGIAPVEWAWRSLAAGRRLPFRPTARGPILPASVG